MFRAALPARRVLRARSAPTSSATFPAEVGYTALYSRTDGVVDWHACLDPAAEQVEVRASHLGMGLNAEVYAEVGHALGTLRRADDGLGAGRLAACQRRVASGRRSPSRRRATRRSDLAAAGVPRRCDAHRAPQRDQRRDAVAELATTARGRPEARRTMRESHRPTVRRQPRGPSQRAPRDVPAGAAKPPWPACGGRGRRRTTCERAHDAARPRRDLAASGALAPRLAADATVALQATRRSASVVRLERGSRATRAESTRPSTSGSGSPRVERSHACRPWSRRAEPPRSPHAAHGDCRRRRRGTGVTTSVIDLACPPDGGASARPDALVVWRTSKTAVADRDRLREQPSAPLRPRARADVGGASRCRRRLRPAACDAARRASRPLGCARQRARRRARRARRAAATEASRCSSTRTASGAPSSRRA